MKGDDPKIDTAQTPKRWNGRLAPLEKIRKTFTDSIPNKEILKKLSLVHTRSFSSLRSYRKSKKTKTQSMIPLSFGSFCTTLTTQKI